MCSFYGECNQTKIQMYNQAAAEEAGAEFHFATTAEYIIMQDGAVAGLVASDADGYIKINCKAVVCACGGMGGNPEMMAYFMPDMAQALTGEDALTSMSANDGRGVQMAYWAGAHLETTPVAGMNMKGLSVPGKMNCLPQAVWIDENGRRFANEYYPTSEQRGYQTVFMSRKTKYAVVDNNFTEYRQYTLPQHAGFTANEENIASLRDSLDKAYAKFKGTYEEPEQEEGQGGPGGGGPMTQVEWIADDTLEGLAGQMGLSGDAATEFVAQIERWNGYCEAGVDEEFGRAAEVLFPVKDGPFYACTFDPVLGETMVTMGGIITDGEQNALGCELRAHSRPVHGRQRLRPPFRHRVHRPPSPAARWPSPWCSAASAASPWRNSSARNGRDGCRRWPRPSHPKCLSRCGARPPGSRRSSTKPPAVPPRPGAFLSQPLQTAEIYSSRSQRPVLPPSFFSRRTSEISMPRSTALHISYTVRHVTEAAVSASISMPVLPVTPHIVVT